MSANGIKVLPLYLVILLGLAAIASGQTLTITSIRSSPETIDYEGAFSIIVTLSGENTCDSVVRFYMDNSTNEFFKRDPVGCGTYEVQSSNWNWDASPLVCGPHTVKAVVTMAGAIMDTKTLDINVGNFPIFTLIPDKPIVGKDVKIVLNNTKGEFLSNIRLIVHSIKGEKDTTIYTAENGAATFTTSSVADRYRVTVDNRKYCGEIKFDTKKNMIVDGPHPSNPVVGEIIMVAIPPGTGALVYDQNGAVYLRAFTDISGAVNFTIKDPGTYTVVMEGTHYWPVNITFTVSEKPIPEISVTPEEPVVGNAMSIQVSSRGSALGAARVTITKPDGTPREYLTPESGRITYDDVSIPGEYIIRVEKDRYNPGVKKINANNKFNVEITPSIPTIEDIIALVVKNQKNDVVSDASFSVEGTNIVGLTDPSGKFTLKLTQPLAYNLQITKDGYWTFKKTITPLGILSMSISSDDIELSESATINVYDGKGSPLTGIIKITKPDNTVDSFESTNYSYTPQKAGVYKIVVGKMGYIDVNSTLNVRTHPLGVNLSMTDKKLILNVTSHENPVSGLNVYVSMPSGNEKVAVTDNSGVVSIETEGRGLVKIGINERNKNVDYETITMDKLIVKSYRYWLLIIPVVLILFIAIGLILIIQILRRSVSRRETQFRKPRRTSLGGR